MGLLRTGNAVFDQRSGGGRVVFGLERWLEVSVGRPSQPLARALRRAPAIAQARSLTAEGAFHVMAVGTTGDDRRCEPSVDIGRGGDNTITSRSRSTLARTASQRALDFAQKPSALHMPADHSRPRTMAETDPDETSNQTVATSAKPSLGRLSENGKNIGVHNTQNN